MTEAYRINNLAVHAQQKRLLNIDDLSIHNQQSTAILGENGAGKTTLLHALAFIQPGVSGEFQVLGQAVNGTLSAALRRRIGLVSQQPYLLPGTVLENLQLALRLQGFKPGMQAEQIDLWLQRLNLQGLIDTDAAKLSGGEQKRVALARTLICQPDILLLDEPFAHLDQQHIHQLEVILHQWAAQPGKTMVFSTHNRFQANMLADKTISLYQGKMIDTPLLNVFHGHYQMPVFDTGKLKVTTSMEDIDANVMAVDPCDIIISKIAPNQSSIRNTYPGKLTQVTADSQGVRLSIDCGERFDAIITEQSLRELALQPGDRLFVSFKASAVRLF
ncbi:ATP-binding cassette domain-containing protein [Methylophaga lonarensis]|uniref:ATP-binding cassette domain-containing protein n=2 Tax=Methylophaga lonarensis TaxID=999151 RepID=UPI003D2BCE61